MKLTKALFLTTLVAGRLLICDSASAQDSTTNMAPSTSTAPATHSHAMNFDKLAQTLSLTDAQKPQVQQLLSAQYQKMQALRQDDSLSADDKKTQMKALRQSTADQMKTILTADQFAKWQSGMMHHHKQQQSSTSDSGSTTSQPAQSQSAQ